MLGRFLQEDVYQGDGLNLYAYCGNNPVAYHDPSGYAKNKKCVQENHGENEHDGESPALTTSPYNPDAVEQRIKPDYKPNPAHDSHSSSYNTHKTPEPLDAAGVYDNAVRGGMGEWYGVNEKGEIYQFFYDNDDGVHFAGIITKADLINKNSSILNLLGLSPKGK